MFKGTDAARDAGEVIYGANVDGYRVEVFRGDVIDEYTAGNHKSDSQAMATCKADRADLKTLRKWARRTALEMAKEHGVQSRHVWRDDSLMSV